MFFFYLQFSSGGPGKTGNAWEDSWRGGGENAGVNGGGDAEEWD